MAHGEDDPKLVAEGELALARLALDGDNLAHAARHISCALAASPALPEAHEALARLAVRAGDQVLDFFPVVGDVYVGAAVAHAHLVAAERPTAAFDLLIAATQVMPSAPWAAVPWLEAEDFPGRWDAENLAQRFMRLAGAVPEPVGEDLRPALEPYLRLARRAVAIHPNSPILLGAASAIARRFECVDEAIEWAARAARREPSLLTEMWLGYAYRTAGQVDEAVSAWRRALRHDPRNLALYTDIAEILAAAGRLGEALDWISRALRLDRHDGYAFPTSCVLRFLHNGDIGHLVALSDHVRAHPDHEHAQNMLTRACHGHRWLGRVGGGDDAVTDLLRQVRAADELTAGGSARLSALEVPSAVLTLERTIPGLALSVAQIPAPDLRKPRRAGAFRLWAYERTVARPAVAVPSPAATEALSALTKTAWPHPAAAYDMAVRLATVSLDNLVSLLAHPPVQPVDSSMLADPGRWVRAVQVWACLGILHHRADQPWPSSVRRRILVDLVFGIEDWVAEAALYALVTAAWVAPEIRADVTGLVCDRFADALEVSRHRPVSIVWSLARLVLITPEMEVKTRRAARTVVEDLDRGRRSRDAILTTALRQRLRRRLPRWRWR